mmetsp:Transcript_6898/g.19362  ORF Transcript_6898/g.19362 Transcript_6898/m.19362 type:complete len:533 (+) Transcript_6898:519-2117(+)
MNRSPNDNTTNTNSSSPQQHIFNPSMMMLVQQQQQQNQQGAASLAAQEGGFASNPNNNSGISTDHNVCNADQQADVSSMLFSLSNDVAVNTCTNPNVNDVNNSSTSMYSNAQAFPTAMAQALQAHQQVYSQPQQAQQGPIVIPPVSTVLSNNMGRGTTNVTRNDASNIVMQQQQPQIQQPQNMALMMPTIPASIAQQLLVQLQQQGPSANPSIALLTGSLQTNLTSQQQQRQHVSMTQQVQSQQQALLSNNPTMGAVGAVANISTNAAAAAAGGHLPKKVGRRGDPRMHEAVRYRLTHPKCTLLDALVHGGFLFPPLHLANVSDRFVRDANGVTLSQRKNQLMRRLRVIEKGVSNSNTKKKKKKTAKSEDGSSDKSDDDSSSSTSSSNDMDSKTEEEGTAEGPAVIPSMSSSNSVFAQQQPPAFESMDAAAGAGTSMAATTSGNSQAAQQQRDMEIRNQLMINQLKMVLLQQQIQAQGQEGPGEQQQQQQQQPNAEAMLMLLQTKARSHSSEVGEEDAKQAERSNQRNAKSA